MITQFDMVRGFDVGLEYAESPEFGFVVMLSLGLLRLTFYKDLFAVDGDEEDGEE
jgi:hypothetical protein